MSEFNDRFGGTQIQPADVAYREFTSGIDSVLQWPPYATKDNVVAKVMNFKPTLEGLTLLMPDAREASPGETVIFYNNSTYAYDVATVNGTPITNLGPGARHIVLLVNNTTPDGSWMSTLLGVGTGALDIAGSAGAGLQAVGTRLNVAFPVTTVPSSRLITEADRDHVLVWTGGSGQLNLPLAATLADFNIEVRNQGTGVLTLQPNGGQLIDGMSNIVVNNDESLWLHSASDLSFWTTVGRGRSTEFAFTQLQKTVTGGDVLLTLTEAANVVQTYTGVLTSNCDIIFPSIVQVYFVSNQTTGAFNLRFRNIGPGLSVSLPQGQSAVLISDGINVTNAATTTAGVTQVAYGPGTVSAPSVSINGLNNGFFSPGSGEVSYSSSGVEVVKMTGAGLQVVKDANPVIGVKATTGGAQSVVDRPPGSSGGFVVESNTFPRWDFIANSAPESVGNLGSDLQINRYADNGTLIDTPIHINRATGLVTFTGARDKSLVGSVQVFIGPVVTRTGFLHLDGSLVSRATYADLYTFAVTAGLVTEDQWLFEGYSGRFSVGNGTTTFRLPDTRGVFFRGLDSSRGLDVGREWGKYQEQALLSHVHGLSDPGHNHAASDPGHSHGVGDPGHGHPISDPGHVHVMRAQEYQISIDNVAGKVLREDFGGVSGLEFPAVTGIGIVPQGTGISIGTSGTGLAINPSGTGMAVQATGAVEAHPRNQAYPLYVRY